jgi:hypothetical protein
MAAVLSLSVAEIIGRWAGYDFSGRGDLPDLLREMCAGHEVRFIDFTPALAAASARGILTFNPIVDSHLNAAGDEVVAETLAEQMSEIVSGAQPESGPLG